MRLDRLGECEGSCGRRAYTSGRSRFYGLARLRAWPSGGTGRQCSGHGEAPIISMFRSVARIIWVEWSPIL